MTTTAAVVTQLY